MRTKYKKLRELRQKYSKVNKRLIAMILLVVFLILASWAVYALHLADISKNYSNLIYEKVANDVRNDSMNINMNISKNSQNIGNLGENLSNQAGLERSDILDRLRTTRECTEFIDIFYTDADGKNGFNSKNQNVSGYLRPYINDYDGVSRFNVFNNDAHISTNKPSYIAIAPVKNDNVITGYVFGVNTYDNFDSNVSLSRTVNEDIVIISADGRMVFLIRNGQSMVVEDGLRFFKFISDYITQDEYEEFVDDYNLCMSTGTSGSFFSESGYMNVLFMYSPLDGIYGWSVMHCINEEGITQIIRNMLISSIIMFFVIVVFLVVAASLVINYIRSEHKRAENLEYLDSLTGVMNRHAFTSKAEEVIRENPNISYHIACLDILNFRIINESYGHERSDIIIKALADACKEAVGKNEIFGRISADIFVVLAVNDGEYGERVSFLEEKVMEKARMVNINHQIKIKVGIYEINDDREPVTRMIDKANAARKNVNANSKLLVCKYSDDLLDEAKRIELIESKMEQALADGEFKPFLQAKYDMEKKQICGAETLVRWVKPDGTMIPPGDFIPLFEKNGFVEKVDFYMLEEVCKYLRRMIDENREVFPVSVNQSRYLLNDIKYVSKVKEILLRYSIPVGLIELELTETVFFHEKDRMIEMMNDLKHINVNLSIDDFGSGYSSFSMLKDVPFDVLKIDRAFLADSVHLEKGRWILKEIIEMANGLGMEVICEGVETEEQSEMLVSLGCKKAQGFLYARPIPMDEFIEKYNIAKS